jgi:hypothetical protein
VTTYTPGQRVVCISSGGCWWVLTEGATYTVVNYEPPYTDKEARNYTWPAYLTVVGNEGKHVTAHAHRFRLEEPA